jgi:hypothetical protein
MDQRIKELTEALEAIVEYAEMGYDLTDPTIAGGEAYVALENARVMVEQYSEG